MVFKKIPGSKSVVFLNVPKLLQALFLVVIYLYQKREKALR